jgi:hypothetical protein
VDSLGPLRLLALQAPAIARPLCDCSPFKRQQKTAFWIRLAKSMSQGPLAGYVSRLAHFYRDGHKYSGAVYVAAAIFNSEYGDSRQGNPALFFRGGRGRKKARLDVVRVLLIRENLASPRKKFKAR